MLTMNQFFYNLDNVLSNFSFPKPIKRLQTCISVASLRHQRASIIYYGAH